MKGKELAYWICVFLLVSIPFMQSTGAHNFPSGADSSLVVQDKAGIISASIQQQIVSINDYLQNKNLANVVILTFDDNIKGDKDYFINNYKRKWDVGDNRTFIIAIFPNDVVINVDKAIAPYFSDLLLEGFQRKIMQAKREGNLDEALLEVTQKVHEKLKGHGWASLQMYKIKEYVNNALAHFGVGGETTTMDRFIYGVSRRAREVERALTQD